MREKNSLSDPHRPSSTSRGRKRRCVSAMMSLNHNSTWSKFSRTLSGNGWAKQNALNSMGNRNKMPSKYKFPTVEPFLGEYNVCNTSQYRIGRILYRWDCRHNPDLRVHPTVVHKPSINTGQAMGQLRLNSPSSGHRYRVLSPLWTSSDWLCPTKRFRCNQQEGDAMSHCMVRSYSFTAWRMTRRHLKDSSPPSYTPCTFEPGNVTRGWYTYGHWIPFCHGSL